MMAKKKKSKKGKVAGGIGILAVIAALGFFGGKELGLGGGGGLGLGKDANVNADADKQQEQDGVHQREALIVDFFNMLNGHCSHLQSGRRRPNAWKPCWQQSSAQR